MKKVNEKLRLNQVGFLELCIAIYPILSGYAYGILHGSYFFIILFALFALTKKQHYVNMKMLAILIIFYFFHEFFLIFIINIKSYFINNTITCLLSCLSIFPIVKSLNYKKFVGSLNWVSLICILGLLYQFILIKAGYTVHPLKLPFMPSPPSDSRLYEIIERPTSFFWEPAAFVTFMMIPLFISLKEKNFIWSGIIIFSMFLSTSSTGILLSMLMLIVYIFTQKIKLKTRLGILILGAGLLYFFITNDIFEYGRNKIENTDIEKTSRIINGPLLLNSLTTNEIIWGIPAANTEDYIKNNSLPGFLYTHTGTIFISTFFLILAKYGILGLLLYLSLYFSIFLRNKSVLPYIVVIYLSMFFQGFGIGSNTFVFQLIFLYSFVYWYNRNIIKVIK